MRRRRSSEPCYNKTMKKILLIGVIVIAAFVIYALYNQSGGDVIKETEVPEVLGDVVITPISHATMALEWDGEIVYTDPVGGAEVFEGIPTPDVILITDIHGDHLNAETLEAVAGPETVVFMPQAVADMLTETAIKNITVIANGEKVEMGTFSIEAIPMYNLPESDDSRHTKGRGNGYVLERTGTRVYIAGDTADIPEMRALENIDIAFVPMNLPFTMTVEDAADATIEFAPKKAYPYHYRGRDGLSDIEVFKQIVNDADPAIEVVLLNWYPE